MEVKKIYRDEQGHWHIDYEPNHLVGLALRVYIGQILIGLVLGVMFFVMSMLVNLIIGEPILDKDRDLPPEEIRPEKLFFTD